MSKFGWIKTYFNEYCKTVILIVIYIVIAVILAPLYVIGKFLGFDKNGDDEDISDTTKTNK